MNKSLFIDEVSKITGLTKKDSEAAVNAYHEVVTKALKSGDNVQFVGFGTYEVAKRSARTGRNPQTGEEIKIKATKVPKFKAGKKLKDSIK